MSCVSPLLVLSSSLQDNNHFPPTLPSTPPFPEHPTSPSRFFCAVRINRPSSLKIYQQLPVKMVIKRKRSESELSSFSSAFSSPTRPGSQSIDTLAIGQINWGALSSRSSTPNHLPSRTMKRFRDNRPSESEVHRESPNASHRPVKTLTRTPPLRTHIEPPLLCPTTSTTRDPNGRDPDRHLSRHVRGTRHRNTSPPLKQSAISAQLLGITFSDFVARWLAATNCRNAPRRGRDGHGVGHSDELGSYPRGVREGCLFLVFGHRR